MEVGKRNDVRALNGLDDRVEILGRQLQLGEQLLARYSSAPLEQFERVGEHGRRFVPTHIAGFLPAPPTCAHLLHGAPICRFRQLPELPRPIQQGGKTHPPARFQAYERLRLITRSALPKRRRVCRRRVWNGRIDHAACATRIT